MSTPYKTTPVFDEHTLPASMQKEHRTKPGVWGVVRVLEGALTLHWFDTPDEQQRVDVAHPGLILPDQPHRVELIGAVRMKVEFYDHLPLLVTVVL